MMDLHDICTFVMPFRIESPERKRNLIFALEWLAPLNARIILLEADVKPQLNRSFFNKNVEYIFVEDSNPVFYRTHYINMLLRHAETEMVSVWDTDIVTAYPQIEETVQNIRNGYTLAYPYRAKCVMLSPEHSDDFIKNRDLRHLEELKLEPIFNRTFCGGAFFVNRQKYLSLGGENEHFIGWGPEDAERLRRVQIMGHQAKWTESGAAYHLYHPRKENSFYFNEDVAIKLRKEFVKVCSMDREELSEYIKTFPV